MANLITSTGNTTYTMVINGLNSTGFKLNAIETDSNIIGINFDNTLLDTNYQINSSGEIIQASFDIDFALTAADIAYLKTLIIGATDVRIGWALSKSSGTENAEFKYFIGESQTENSFLTAAPASDTEVNWLAESEMTGIVNLKIKYKGVSSVFTPGDNITFNVDLYVQEIENSEAAGDPVKVGTLPDLTVTVKMCILNALATTTDIDLLTKTSFFIGDDIIFKTKISPTLTNANYLRAKVVNIIQSINEAIQIDTNKIYLTIEDTQTVDTDKPTGAIKVTNLQAGSDVNFTVDSQTYPAIKDDTTELLKDFWVWIYGKVIAIPA